MSCAGNPWVHTPAMDALARSGTRFERAYCSQPLCVPSRSSLFTGRMPHEVGVPINRHEERDSVSAPFMGARLARAGYATAYVGKWHLPVPDDQTERHGFAWTEHTRGGDTDPNVAGGVEAWLDRRREEPFCLVASFHNPHDICQYARGEALPNGPIPPTPPPEACPPAPANLEPPEGEPECIRRVQGMDGSAYPTVGWTAEAWRQYRWGYYRMVERVDAEIGKVVHALRARGLAETTLIVFASDHGDGLGAHRWNQKQVLYEESARVPLIVCGPGVREGAVDRDHLVRAGVDLLPTFLDYAGAPATDELAGRSLRPLVATGAPAADWPDQAVSETEFCGFGHTHGVTGRALWTGAIKYVVYSEGARREQLFDLARDPGETDDRIDDPAYAAAARDRRRRLRDWCAGTDDPFLPNVPE